MKKFALLLLLLLLPSFAFTQTIGSANVTATANFTLKTGQTLTMKAQIVGCSSGQVPIYQGNPISNTPNQTASSPFTANGSEVVSFTVPGNDQILCGGQNYTLYAITWLINGFPAAPTKTYRFTDDTTTNLNTAVAVGFVPPMLQNSIGSQCAAGYVLNGYHEDFTPICQAISPAQTVVSTSTTDPQSLQSSLSAPSFIGPLTGTASGNLPLTGGTLSGALTLSGDPTTTNEAATKHYVDTQAATKLSLSGGTVNGVLVAKSLNGALNASQYCNVAGTLDQSCIENAIAAASDGQQVYVPAGTYEGTNVTITQSDVRLVLDPGAKLNFNLTFAGQGFYRSNTVTPTNCTTVECAAGTTTFSGNFSAYTAGAVVLIEQVSSQSDNQIGLEFDTVSSASSTQLVLSSGTRFPYRSPNISLVADAVSYTGSLVRGAFQISGNYTGEFAVGDLIRIDNTTGTDSPASGNTAYFEIARVAAVSSSAVTLEAALHNSYTNPWLVKVADQSNLSVEGGYIQNLTVNNYYNSSIHNLSIGMLIMTLDYDYRVVGIRGVAGLPVSVGLTWDSHGSVSDLVLSDTVSSTDNGAFKVMSCADSVFSNIHGYYGTATGQGSYPFMVDYSYTPYNVWNSNLSISGISTNGVFNGSAYGIFIFGTRNSTVTGLSTDAGITLLNNSLLTGSAWNSTGHIEIGNGDGYNLSDFIAGGLNLGGEGVTSNSRFSNFIVTGVDPIVGRAVWLHSNQTNIHFENGYFYPSANLTFYIQDATVTTSITNVEDSAANSIYNGGIAASLILGANHLSGSISGCGCFTPQDLPAGTTIAGHKAETQNNRGVANGYASLDGSTLIPTAQQCSGTATSGTYCDGGTRSWTNALSVEQTNGTLLGTAHIVTATGTLATGSATVVLTGNAAYTNYINCVAVDGTAPNPIGVVLNSHTSITLTGTGSDAYQLLCIGN